MRKILTGCIIATAIASVYPAAAQIFSYSYTDAISWQRRLSLPRRATLIRKQ